MSPLTAAFTSVLDRFLHRPVESLDLGQIQAGRGRTYPEHPPFSWVTGPVDRSVGITFGTAPARDGYEVPLRIYRPRAVRDTDTDVPVILYFHGGGWVQGNVVMYDPLCTHLAAQVRSW
jgi:acetyl esterase